MSADYTGTSVPTLNNSPASSWTTDAAKKSHVNDLYLVTGNGASAGNLYAFEEYTSNQFTPLFNWFETWTVPKITRDNGQVIVLPKPQEYTPEIYDVDAATTGRNAAGTMIRDRVAQKHKFNYKFAALSQQDVTEILNAVQDVSFTLTTASPETGAKTNYRVYVGDRSLPVYWMPTHAKTSWMYSSLSLNLIEM